MQDVEAILAQFDFTSHGNAAIPPELAWSEDKRRAIARAHALEEYSALGNLENIRRELSELRITDPAAFGKFIERPGCVLARAVRNRHLAVVEYLLQQGLAIDPYAVVLATESKDTQMLSLLLEHGWDINMQIDLYVPPALSLAVEDRDMTAWFLEHGASPNARCALDITPLSCAVQHAPLPVIQMLFDHGGSIQHGQLLHYAVWRCLPDSRSVLDLIISKHPPINSVMYQGDLDSYYKQRMFSLGTPLHEAAAYGKREVAQVLIEHGAHPLIKDSRGEIPLQRAERARAESVIQYLQPISAGATWPESQFTHGRETTGWS